MEREVFYLVDRLINDKRRWGEVIFSERLGYYTRWAEVLALEEMVEEGSKEHPLLWNVGIGPGASFVRTFTRLLFNRTKDLYGPYDLIAHVRLPTAEAPSSRIVQQHWLAFEFFMEMARTLKIQQRPDNIKELQELKQLAAEESYFGYGTISNNLMLQALGREYIYYFGSDSSLRSDLSYDHQPYSSPILELIKKAMQGKRQLLLVETLHVPVSLDVLVVTTGRQRPSPFHSRRWLISTTSKDVYEQSRGARGLDDLRGLHLHPEYCYAPPYDDLRQRDWAMLIRVCNTARPTRIPESTTQIQCNYYRSAYEAGKRLFSARQLIVNTATYF
ncbi:uncharacterized protein [Miscanthus floridulus]|uniref:uncharacterized protein n=1 Tax=Miscanthus floridulus TaxID=154761 RepID=UPI0034597D62